MRRGVSRRAASRAAHRTAASLGAVPSVPTTIGVVLMTCSFPWISIVAEGTAGVAETPAPRTRDFRLFVVRAFPG
ncbi:hypothetical protein Asp14428_04060 [Actinoplanes sp. NBRC 14428]|nr:hypothetical protein Asp14428_04060 [Actinoplanes sp. NBRC 14428]